ncbi:MAG TPA: phospholipase domain-containing protein, partial [Chitinophagaceae bacterium]
GWVNSQVFDHTSSLQLLEKWLSAKYRKDIREPNISNWRRAVAGDLTSVFRKEEGDASANPEFLNRDKFVETIHKAQFKNPPSNFRALTPREVEQLVHSPHTTMLLPQQETGTRNACAIPYELYADMSVGQNKDVVLRLKSGTRVFGNATAGAPFHVYAPLSYHGTRFRTWAYTVAPGDELTSAWSLDRFDQPGYCLRVHGPNGFFREFANDGPFAGISVQLKNAGAPGTSSGSYVVLENTGDEPLNIVIRDNAYGLPEKSVSVAARQSVQVPIDVSGSYGWYDFTVMIKEQPKFAYHYAGHIETGAHSKTDPLMGDAIGQLNS